MAHVKGSAVKSTVLYLKNSLGEEGYAKLLSSLPPECVQEYSGGILQSTWYSFGGFVSLMEAAGKVLPPPPGHSLAWELGRFSAEQGMNTVYRAFFKVADIGFVMKRAVSVFASYYDSGTMEMLDVTDHSATLKITGFDQPCIPFCDRVQGWVERLLEMTGSKRIRIGHPICAARGGPCCEIRAEWS